MKPIIVRLKVRVLKEAILLYRGRVFQLQQMEEVAVEHMMEILLEQLVRVAVAEVMVLLE